MNGLIGSRMLMFLEWAYFVRRCFSLCLFISFISTNSHTGSYVILLCTLHNILYMYCYIGYIFILHAFCKSLHVDLSSTLNFSSSTNSSGQKDFRTSENVTEGQVEETQARRDSRPWHLIQPLRFAPLLAKENF